MGHIEEAQRETLFPAIFGVAEFNTDFLKILGHIVKREGLGILDPQHSVGSTYNIFKAASEELLGYLLGGTNLNYVGHRACIHSTSVG